MGGEEQLEVKRLTREAKTRIWKDNLMGIEPRKDVAGAWRVVGALSGGPKSETGQAAITYRGKRCTTDLAKANAFNQEYAEVSGRKSDRESRRVAEETARLMTSYETDDPAECDFMMAELESALREVKTRKAAVPDGIRSKYVRKLTEKAREWLLPGCAKIIFSLRKSHLLMYHQYCVQ